MSPRIAGDDTEPTFNPNINITLNRIKSGILNGRYVANGVCHNCRTWPQGFIEFNATKQPMIYAVGPSEVHLRSDAGDAALRRHDYHGRFSIDMLQASRQNLDPARFPLEITSNNGSSPMGHGKDDHEYGSAVHAIFMASVFVILFPLGTVFLRILGKVRWHWITQAVGFLIILIGAATGIYVSLQYNRVCYTF